MEYPVDEPDARALVWVLIGKLYVDLPETTSKWSLLWAFEPDVEFLHVVIDQSHLIVAHEPVIRVRDACQMIERVVYIFMTSVSILRFGLLILAARSEPTALRQTRRFLLDGMTRSFCFSFYVTPLCLWYCWR